MDQSQTEREVNESRTGHRVGLIGDVLLVETVVAVVGQDVGDTLALGIEHRHVELHAFGQQAVAVGTVQDACDAVVGYLLTDGVDEVWLAWPEPIDDVDLLAIVNLFHIDPGIEIALVAQFLLQVGAGCCGFCTIEDDRCLAHGAQGAVDPFR